MALESGRLDNIKLFKYFLSEDTKHLTSTEKLVALAIAKHRNNVSMKCNPGKGRIAKITGLGWATVKRAISGLVKEKEIARLQIKDGTKNLTNQYYFRYDFADALKIFENIEFYDNHTEEHENFEYCQDKNIFPAEWYHSEPR
jgi:thiaminase